MIATAWSLLVEATLATGAAVIVAWTLRRTLAQRFGFGVAYAMWSVVPLSLLAILLPARAVPLANAAAGQVLGQVTLAGLPTAGISLVTGALAVWLAGAVGMLLLQLARQRRFMAALGPLKKRDDGLYAAEHDCGLPALTGLLRKRVIVPRAFDHEYSEQERRLVLYHEHVHLQRGDLHANAVATLLRCVFWFNPLIHLAARCFEQDQELSCDQAVITRFPQQRRAYADAMLKTQISHQALPLGCHWTGHHPLKERIAMLKQSIPSPRRSMLGFAVVLSLCAATAMAAWAAQPAAVPPLPPAPPAPSEAPPAPAAPPAPLPDGIQGTAPKYPAAAAEQKLGGRVMLVVDLAADGSVTDAMVESAQPAGVFDASALQAVKSWKFNPQMEDGKPVAGRVRVPIDFSPDGPPPPPAPPTAPTAPTGSAG